MIVVIIIFIMIIINKILNLDNRKINLIYEKMIIKKKKTSI